MSHISYNLCWNLHMA